MTESVAQPWVLVVDDERPITDLVAMALKYEGPRGLRRRRRRDAVSRLHRRGARPGLHDGCARRGAAARRGVVNAVTASGVELVAGAAVTLVILAAAWLIVHRGLRPLDRMGRAVGVAATDLSVRVEPASSQTEVGRLGLAINGMLEQLENAFAERAANEQRLRHFVSGASHELRTPLTSIRGCTELMRRNPQMTDGDVRLATRRIEEEGRRMGVLVDDLLLLARLDQGRPLEHVAVDLDALAADACADARAADPGRRITLRIDGAVRVQGDDMRLRQVLGNLLRNALVHTPASTPIEVTVAASHRDAVVEVIDHGPRIHGAGPQHIFERFHRSDPARSADQGGSGLGLSIVAAVVSAHGGRIDVRDTAGGGATFRITLPGAEVDASRPALPG